jgi:hypothetical protein
MSLMRQAQISALPYQLHRLPIAPDAAPQSGAIVWTSSCSRRKPSGSRHRESLGTTTTVSCRIYGVRYASGSHRTYNRPFLSRPLYFFHTITTALSQLLRPHQRVSSTQLNSDKDYTHLQHATTATANAAPARTCNLEHTPEPLTISSPCPPNITAEHCRAFVVPRSRVTAAAPTARIEQKNHKKRPQSPPNLDSPPFVPYHTHVIIASAPITDVRDLAADARFKILSHEH